MKTPPPTLLLVSGLEMITTLLRELLADRRCRSLSANTTHEAIQIYSQHSEEIDLVLLDADNLAVSPLWLLDALKAYNPAVKCVLLFGGMKPELQPVLQQDSVYGVVTKPFFVQELLDVVEVALSAPLSVNE